MENIVIEKRVYDWMVEFVKNTQEPKTHEEIARLLNCSKNTVTHYIASMKRKCVPYCKIKRLGFPPSYQTTIKLDDFLKRVEIKKEKVNIKKRETDSKGETKAETSDDGIPWYILSTECKIIYKSKIRLTKSKGVIHCKQLY